MDVKKVMAIISIPIMDISEDDDIAVEVPIDIAVAVASMDVVILPISIMAVVE